MRRGGEDNREGEEEKREEERREGEERRGRGEKRRKGEEERRGGEEERRRGQGEHPRVCSYTGEQTLDVVKRQQGRNSRSILLAALRLHLGSTCSKPHQPSRTIGSLI